MRYHMGQDDAFPLRAVSQPVFYRRPGVQHPGHLAGRRETPGPQDRPVTQVEEHEPAAGGEGLAGALPPEPHFRRRLPLPRLHITPAALMSAPAYRPWCQPDPGALLVHAAAWPVDYHRRCRTYRDVRLRGVEDPGHPVAVELFPLGDHIGRDRRVLDLDHGARGGHYVSAMRAHHHLAALRRDGQLPAPVPFSHRLGPGVAISAGVM